jgi:hypothetical protein
MEGEYLLTEEMKSTIPFHGNEKIVLKDNLGNLVELNAGELEDNIFKDYLDSDEIKYSICEDYTIDLSNDSNTLYLSISSCLVPDPKNIWFNFCYNELTGRFRSSFGVLVEEIPDLAIDSLMVNGKWFHQIYYDTMLYTPGEPFPSELARYPVYSYYSTSLGVVKIDFSDGSSWELEEIKWE